MKKIYSILSPDSDRCMFSGNLRGASRETVDLPGSFSHPSDSLPASLRPALQSLNGISSFDHTITRAMGPQKHVAEVPRSILPRLTWNSSFSRPSISSHTTLATRPRQPQPHGCSPPKRQIHSLNIQLHQSYRGFSTSLHDHHNTNVVSRRRPAPTRPSAEPLSNPVRHNGVYVAAFKPARRAFHATPARPREHHFDTLKFVKRLQAEGFSEEQAVAMMRVLNDIIQESIQNLTRTMVLREGERYLSTPGDGVV